MPVPIERLITPDIHKPARYLGNEFGAVRKPWESAIARFCLTYPELYEVGASNLGHIILYSLLNAHPDLLCDRAYLPGPDLAAKLRETGTPLFGVESRRSLREFDVLGFSLSYELGATNVLEMLDLAGIPLTWRDRQDLPLVECPLVFAGGQTATSNPEPYADFFDFFALGDGEDLLPELGAAIVAGKQAGLSRQELLLDLAQRVPGVYVPQFYDMDDATGAVYPNREGVPKRVRRRVATPRPEHSIGLVPLVETVHDRLTIEVRRGCTRGCRFCQPGMLTRPARDVDPQAVVDTIERAVRETGYNEFSLLSLSCSDYLALPAVGMEIKNRLRDERVVVSLPSQRVDRFDETIANIVKSDGRQTGLTFAPEAGTQRLRDVINKGLTDAELLRGIKTACEEGWDRVKLYFMIGLPTETDEDVLGIVRTMAWLQQECRAPGRKRLGFTATISNFTPKPHTPFQWHAVSTEDFLRKQQLLRDAVRQYKDIKLNFTDVRISALEDFLGRGDRRWGATIRLAWEKGAGMDAWFESADRAFGAWEEAIAEAGLTWATPAPAMEAPLPWDIVDTGIDTQWLKDEWERAIAAQTVPDCSFEGCSRCGICGPHFGHNIVVPPPPIPEYLGAVDLGAIPRVQRLRFTFGKLGSMALISHLDLLRLMARTVRRAGLPVAYSGGFHPSPRIAIAGALPLGYSSTAEYVDLELTERLDPEDVRQRLAAQLSDEIPLYSVEELPVEAPSTESQLERATYTLTLVGHGVDRDRLAAAIANILAAETLPMPKTTKSGKETTIELRDRLFGLELLAPEDGEGDDLQIRVTGTYRPDGTSLKPEHVVFALNRCLDAGEVTLQHARRDRLELHAPDPHLAIAR